MSFSLAKMLTSLSTHPIATAVTVILLTLTCRFLKKGYDTRRKFHNLPGPPHSWIWGHLKVMDEAMREVPPKIHPHVLPLRIKAKYNLPNNYFYMDLWPFSDPMFQCFDPRIANDINVDRVLPKHPGMSTFMHILAGPGDMVSSNGALWKRWRTVFNPGFAASHLMTLVPSIVDQSVIFADKLSKYAASGQIFRLEEDATRLTVDIIGKVALDLPLGTQTGENEMITAFREQVFLCPNEGPRAPFKMYYPTGIYKRWRNSQIMNKYIGKVLDERFAKQGSQSNGSTATVAPGQRKQRKRAIIDLALEEYRSETSATDQHKDTAGIDEEFKKAAVCQIRTFVFAGHDTTSSTICYAVYMLQKHPDCLAKIREEHDRVLGPVENTPDLIREEPHILNKLEYTTAVIRETLRLWSPASGTREAAKGTVLHDPDTGEALPVDDMLIWVIINGMQRNPTVWGPTVNSFDPSRFLPDKASELPENGWRPFEKGPRNCIGQDLAMVESRVILALIVRQFDFHTAYAELDKLKGDGSFWAQDEAWREGKQDWDGEEAYQILIGTAKPREGMPVRVRKVR